MTTRNVGIAAKITDEHFELGQRYLDALDNPGRRDAEKFMIVPRFERRIASTGLGLFVVPLLGVASNFPYRRL